MRLGFRIFNRIGNPAIVALLRSRAHRFVSGRLLLITVTGRRSGRSFEIPVGYRREGDRLTIPVVMPAAKLWWRNLRGGAPVHVLLRGERRPGTARAEGDETAGVKVLVELG
jgi:hypothetical protein